jgi:hypothetical protein
MTAGGELEMALEYCARGAEEALCLGLGRPFAQDYSASSAIPTEWLGASPIDGPPSFQ